MISDIELIKNCDPILEKKIILYGGGDCGTRAAIMLQRLGIPVEAVCTTRKEGLSYELKRSGKIRRIDVPELKKLDETEDLLIVIATTINEFTEQILKILDQYQIFRGQRVTYLGLWYACTLNPKIDADGRLACEHELWCKACEDLSRGGGYYAIWEGFSQNAIWVYTPGKVGTSTLCASLDKCGVPNVHTHKMGKERLKYGCMGYLDGRKLMPARQFDEYELFFKYMKENVRIITAVRDPIARDISGFFESFHVPYSNWIDQTNDIYGDFKRMTENDIKKYNMFEWFNEELQQVFGVDVYAYPFDREKGYTIIEEGNISILLLKLEKLNTLESVVGDFLQVKDFKLVNANESKSKPYRYMYEEFKKNVRLSQSYVDRYYQDNPYMDHFYSEEEKKQFVMKWKIHIQ